MKLSEVKSNSVVTIKEFQSGRGLQHRLLSMGLFPGNRIKVLNSSRKSPVTLKVKDAVLTIGHGMASKISVEII